MRSAISPERSALPLSKLDNVGRETRKAFAAAVTVKPADSIISVRINSPGWGIAIEGYHVATVKLWTDDEVAAVPAVKAVFDDIRATRKSDFVNNFWRALANQPSLLERTWDSVKQVMIAPGVLDPLTKELVYIAISTANSCSYCIHSHTAAARAKGLSDEQYAEFLAVIGMAAETNTLANSMQIPVDQEFLIQYPWQREGRAETRMLRPQHLMIN